MSQKKKTQKKIKIGSTVKVSGLKGYGKVTYIRYDGNTQKVEAYKVKRGISTPKFFNPSSVKLIQRKKKK